MKKIIPILLILSAVKLIIHCFGNQNYGFHRDELLHLSVSEHLDWGYMEFPPFIALIGKLSYLLFDYSLTGVRLFPTLAGVGLLLLCCLIAKELGAKSKGILLAGLCVLAFVPFYRNHTLFQPVAFNQFFWALGFYLLVRFLKTENKNFLLLLGLTAGLGIMNKYTFVLWVFGAIIGLLFYNKGKIFRNKWLYISGLIAFLIVLPNLIWQVNHDFPLLSHLAALKEKQLSAINPFEFGLQQLELPFTLVVSLFGLWAFLRDQSLQKYRALGLAVLFIFGSMWLLNAKAYYVFGIYPVLFAGGAVKLELLLRKRPALMYAVAAIVLIPSLPFIPLAAPVLPVEDYIKFAGKKETNGRVELTGDFADMFGWEEQVKLVDSVYQNLSATEKANCVIWAENYGEAGALKVLGKQYGLPDPISRHGSFWMWGYKKEDAKVWISLGNEKEAVESVFEESRLIKKVRHKYAIGEENNIPLYLCRKPKVDIDKWWKGYEEFVFD